MDRGDDKQAGKILNAENCGEIGRSFFEVLLVLSGRLAESSLLHSKLVISVAILVTYTKLWGYQTERH